MPTLPIKQMEPVSFSVMTNKKGRFNKNCLVSPIDVTSIPTAVTAAASEPFSLTSIKVFCNTNEIWVFISLKPLKFAFSVNAMPKPKLVRASLNCFS